MKAAIITGTYVTTDQGVEIRLFAKAEDGTSVVLKTREFNPYLVVEWHDDLKFLLELNASVTSYERIPLKVPPWGEIEAVRVYVKQPQDVPPLRKDVLEAQGHKVYSSDIQFHLRYMYDMDIGPFVNITTVMDFTHDSGVEEHWIKEIERSEPFDLKLKWLSVDIENSMEREDKKIFCTGWSYYDEATEDSEEGIIDGAEGDIIDDLNELIRIYDPDVITGYNINQYDLPHIEDRAFGNKRRLPIGRDGTYPRARFGGKSKDLSWSEKSRGDIERWVCNGRIVADAWLLARVAFKPKREKLNFVAKLLGFGGKLDVDTSHIDQEWRDDPVKVMEYCTRDAWLAMKIAQESRLVEGAIHLARYSNLPIEMCLLPRQSWMVDGLAVRRFDQEGWAVPMNKWGEKFADKIKGAKVFDPVPGLHRWVNVFDFKGMYPAIIIGNNVCYSTYVPEEEVKEDEEYFVSPTGSHFHKRFKGIMPTIMEELRDLRDSLKRQYSETGDELSNRLQDTVKILMNAFYGLFTSAFYRFTNRKIGESITAWAREGIEWVAEEMTDNHIQILYGDTDSVFVKGPDSREECIKQGEFLSNKLTRGAMVLEHEYVLSDWFNYGKKKRYTGIISWPDKKAGETYTRGFRSRRGDSFKLQETIENDTFRKMFDKSIGPDQAVVDASELIRSVLRGEQNIEDLIITKSVKQEADYVRPGSMPGIQVARKMKKYGVRWIPYTKLSWVVVNASVTPQEVEPWLPELKKEPVPDLQYYAAALVKTILDVAKIFGWDEDGLYTGTKPSTLTKFGLSTS